MHKTGYWCYLAVFWNICIKYLSQKAVELLTAAMNLGNWFIIKNSYKKYEMAIIIAICTNVWKSIIVRDPLRGQC